MIQRGHIVQPCDMIETDTEYVFRLSNDEIREMQDTFGCNQGDSEVKEFYLDAEEIASLTIMEEEQYFRMYGDVASF